MKHTNRMVPKVVSIITVLMLLISVVAVTPIFSATAAEVTAGTFDELNSQLTTVSEAKTVKLTANIDITSAITVANDKYAVTIDLCGYTLTNSAKTTAGADDYALIEKGAKALTFENSATADEGDNVTGGFLTNSSKEFVKMYSAYNALLQFGAGTYNGTFSVANTQTDGGTIKVTKKDTVFNCDMILHGCVLVINDSLGGPVVFNKPIEMTSKSFLGTVKLGRGATVTFKDVLNARSIVNTGSSSQYVAATFEKDVSVTNELRCSTLYSTYTFNGNLDCNTFVYAEGKSFVVNGDFSVKSANIFKNATFNKAFNVKDSGVAKLYNGTYKEMIDVQSTGAATLRGGLYYFDPATINNVTIVDTVVDNGNGTYSVVQQNPAFENVSTGESFAKWDDAQKAANEGDVIKLVDDVVMLQNVVMATVSKSGLTLDMNGYSFTDESDGAIIYGNSRKIIVNNGVTFTLTNTSDKESKITGSIYSDQRYGLVHVLNGGICNVSNISVDVSGSGNNGAGIWAETGGTVNIDNVNIKVIKRGGGTCAAVYSYGTLTAKNSSFTGISDKNAFGLANGTAELSNCTLTGIVGCENAAGDMKLAKCTLKAGGSSANGSNIYVKGTVTANNCTVIGQTSASSNPAIAVESTGVLNLIDTSVDASKVNNVFKAKNTAAKIVITSGTFTSKTALVATPATYASCVSFADGSKAYDADGAELANFATATYAEVKSSNTNITITYTDDNGEISSTSVAKGEITLGDYAGTVDKTFVGWSDGEKLYAAGDKFTADTDTTFTAMFISISTDDTAAVRWASDNNARGLKFTNRLDKALFDKLAALDAKDGKAVSAATVGTEISKDNTFATKVTVSNNTESAGWYTDTTDSEYVYCGTASAYEIGKEENLINTTMYARAYVTVYYADGHSAVFYGEVNAGRSMYEVAKAAYDNATDSVKKAVLKDYYGVE